MQQQQPGQFVSGASVARDRRQRGVNRRSSDAVIPRQSSTNSRLPKVSGIESPGLSQFLTLVATKTLYVSLRRLLHRMQLQQRAQVKALE